jgi:hypothetical protein
VINKDGRIQSGRCEPHWTRTPPTDPGWYKILLARRLIFYVKVDKQSDGKNTYLFNGRRWGNKPAANWYLDITHWWSTPETLPPLPEEGEDVV